MIFIVFPRFIDKAMYVWGLVKFQKPKMFRAFFSGTPREIFKILGLKILSFRSTIELHYHL